MPKFEITLKMIRALNDVEESNGFLKAYHLFEEKPKMAFQTCEMKIAEMISKIDPENRDHLKRYHQAFHQMTEYFLEKGPLSEELIFAMHTYLFRGVITNPEALGKYRTVQNYIYELETKKILHTPPPPERVAQEMRQLLGWFAREKRIPLLLKIGIVHLQILSIHPFLDGNGRTAQLVTSVLLHQGGYHYKEYFAIGERFLIDRKNYNQATLTFQAGEKIMTTALEYFITSFACQMKELQERIFQSVTQREKGSTTPSKNHQEILKPAATL